jgi:hypothetical protein
MGTASNIKGMFQSNSTLRGVEFPTKSARVRRPGSHFEFVHASQGRLTMLHFSVFSGKDPQLWRSRCENYFDMYGIELSLWVWVPMMHFEGSMVPWL